MFCSLAWGQFGEIFFQLLRCGLRHVVWKLSSWLPAWANLGTLTWELSMGSWWVQWMSSWHEIITNLSFLRKLSIYYNWFFLWVVSSWVSEACCDVIHHAKQLVLPFPGEVQKDCCWDLFWLQGGLPSGWFMEAWTMPNAFFFQARF